MNQTITMSFAAFAAQVQALGNGAEARALADAYLAAHAGRIPIVEGTTAHFLYRGEPGAQVGVGGDWNGFNGRRSLMAPLGGGLLHYAQELALDARVDYRFFVYGPDGPASHADPLNRHMGESGVGVPNELAMPDYRRPAATIEQPGVPAGTLHAGALESKALRQVRAYTVYLPPDYAAERGPYPSIYFHDGAEYLTMGRAATVCDNLIAAGAIPPVVGIFVPPVERMREYMCDAAFVRFFGDELVPAIGRQYALAADPARRAVIGPSAGGLIALYLGSRRPDLFGLVGGQSSAVRCWGGPRAFDARQVYARGARVAVRLYLAVGRYESCFGSDRQGNCRDLLTPNREFRGVLERAGYAFRYREWSQGHSWGLWRDALPDALTYFFGQA